MGPTLPVIPQVLSTMNPFMRQSPKAPYENHPLAATTSYYGGLKKRKKNNDARTKKTDRSTFGGRRGKVGNAKWWALPCVRRACSWAHAGLLRKDNTFVGATP